MRGATLTQHADGTGTIVWGSAEGDLEEEFGRALASGRSPWSIDVRGIMRAGLQAERQFDRIDSPRTVFGKLQDVAKVEAPRAVPAGAQAAAHSTPSDGPASARLERVKARRTAESADASDRRKIAMMFGVLAVLGLAGTYYFASRHVAEYLSARNWSSVPCTIVSSRVDSSVSSTSDADGNLDTTTVYDVNVAFQYEYKERPYTGTRYQLVPVGLGFYRSREAMRAKVAALPPGLATTCWMDPANPQNAVLDRSMTIGTWLGMIPLIIFVMGIAGLVSVARAGRGR
jgi:uncharacterized protein DUF3592